MGSDEILDTWSYEGLSSRTINTGTGVALCLCSSQWKLSGRRIFWCPQNCASRTNIFANIHFLRTKHIWCWWGHIMLLSAAFIQIQRLFIGNEEADYSREWLISLFHRHHLFPVVTHNYISPDLRFTVPLSPRTFAGSWPLLCLAGFHLNSCVSPPLPLAGDELSRMLPLLPSRHQQVDRAIYIDRHRGQPSNAGKLRRSLPRYPRSEVWWDLGHRARNKLPIKPLSLIKKTNCYELWWKSWQRFYPMFSSFLPTPIDSNFFDGREKWKNQPNFVINETNS